MKIRLSMAREGQGSETGLADDYSQFLVQFPDECFFRPLAALDLAAGKFPKPGHRLAFGPLRDEHAAVGVDEGTRGNENDLGGHDLRPVIAIDGDVFLGQIAREHTIAALAQP
jgi:hypothetical protein